MRATCQRCSSRPTAQETGLSSHSPASRSWPLLLTNRIDGTRTRESAENRQLPPLRRLGPANEYRSSWERRASLLRREEFPVLAHPRTHEQRIGTCGLLYQTKL